MWRGGDARLTTSAVFSHYITVDHFDQCPEAIEKAKAATSKMKRIGQITQASMQEYKWQFFYNAIFMVWCAGYLEKGELVSFLRKCKARLITEGVRISRTNPPYSFIFLMDNIRGEEFTLF